MGNRGLLAFFILLILMPIVAQSQQQPIDLASFSKPPVVDGILDSGEWNATPTRTRFIQTQPDKGQPSSRETNVYAAQFEDNIYLAFVCNVNSQEEIISRIQRRDRVDDSDDHIALILDTHNDHRTGLLFVVNPLGTLGDAKITDDGKNVV